MRSILLETLYELTKIPYQKWFKKNRPWDISVKELVQYPIDTLGFHLGCFLLKHDFSPQPKLENHDVFHVLTELGISVPEEIAMQYYLLGNRKHSLYLITVIFLGSLLYPDKYKLFRKAYKKGKQAYAFHQLDYSKLLHKDINSLRSTFLITSIWK